MKHATSISKNSVYLLACILLGMAITFSVSGCMPQASGSPQETIDPVPKTGYAELVLYFGDDQAMEIWPEFRQVEVPSDPAQRLSEAELVVQELLKGPNDPLLRKTLPPEAKLLSVEVTDGVVLVNFSAEMQTKHWGGSAGEVMTLDSLVTSLTELPGISKVQILIGGKTVETLAGHFDISRPLERSAKTYNSVFTSSERAAELQKRVDEGKETWRKDPLEVARKESGARGLPTNLIYEANEVISVSKGESIVDATGDTESYRITLVQPEKQGDEGIWVISEIASI